MKYELTAVLAIATFAIMMTSATSAFGQATPDTHAADPVPAFGDPNDLFAIQSASSIDPNVPVGVDIYENRIIVIYDPDLGATIPTDPNLCETYTVEVGDRLWELRNTGNGGHIEGSHDNIVLGASTIFYDANLLAGGGAAGDGFGNGATRALISTVGTATLYNVNANPLLNNWVELNAAGNPTGNFDSTSQPGQYQVFWCGFVDVNGDAVFQIASEPASILTRTFLVSQPVGGETMSLSATSLLVAGASANALWILPILGLVGTVIAIRKLEA